VRKGYDRNAPLEAFYPDSTGAITIGLKEDERVEFVLSPGSTTYGYIMIGEQRRLLPVGSTLDRTGGIFYWQVGPAFFGHHRFVFVEKASDGQVTKKILKIVISPKY